jgi:hypothetical protein
MEAVPGLQIHKILKGEYVEETSTETGNRQKPDQQLDQYIQNQFCSTYRT